jgi:hypothetical protein
VPDTKTENIIDRAAAISTALNSATDWPPGINRPSCLCGRLNWWERILWRILRRKIEKEIDFHARIAGMDVIENLIGRKEVMRHWNTKGKSVHPMTNEEFERWWANPREVSEELYEKHFGKAAKSTTPANA